MKKILFAIALISLSPALMAAPKFSEADALLREIHGEMAENTNYLLKSPSTFPQRGKKLQALVSRAEKAFGDVLGPFGACTKAAYAVRDVWQSQMRVTNPSGKVPDLIGLVSQAYTGGQEYMACFALVDALETPKRK